MRRHPPLIAARAEHHRSAGLDLVRATAIVLVIVCHALARGSWLPPPAVYPLGVVGVEIFFVLSGYLIGGIFLDDLVAAEGRLSARMIGEFWVRRWFRTLPNYLLFLAIGLSLSPIDGRRILTYLTFTQNAAWPMPAFYHESWSLALEEWFYLLFPALVLGVQFATGRARAAFLTVVAFLFFAPLLLRLSVATGLAWDAGVRKVVVFRPDALMWGVAIAALERYRGAAFRRLQRPVVFIAAVVLGTATTFYTGLRFAQGGGHDFPATRSDALIFTAFSAACAVALPYCAGRQRIRGLAGKFGHRIAVWSYAMYLSHSPVMLLVARTVRAGGAEASPALEAVLSCGATLVVSALVYKFFEQPLMMLRDRLVPSRARRNHVAKSPVAIPAA